MESNTLHVFLWTLQCWTQITSMILLWFDTSSRKLQVACSCCREIGVGCICWLFLEQ